MEPAKRINLTTQVPINSDWTLTLHPVDTKMLIWMMESHRKLFWQSWKVFRAENKFHTEVTISILTQLHTTTKQGNWLHNSAHKHRFTQTIIRRLLWATKTGFTVLLTSTQRERAWKTTCKWSIQGQRTCTSSQRAATTNTKRLERDLWGMNTRIILRMGKVSSLSNSLSTTNMDRTKNSAMRLIVCKKGSIMWTTTQRYWRTFKSSRDEIK